MAERKQCEFQLIRYVPDPVKNEFVNIGVLLRAATGEQSELRFTRDWGRVLCLDPDADTQMLEALEIEIGHRLRAQLRQPPQAHPRLCWKGRFPTGCRLPKPRGIWRRALFPAWRI